MTNVFNELNTNQKRLKTCKVCGKHSLVEETFWVNDKQVIRESCINIMCESYTPYAEYKMKPKSNNEN